MLAFMPGPRLAIVYDLETQDGEDPVGTQKLPSTVNNWSIENIILSNIARALECSSDFCMLIN